MTRFHSLPRVVVGSAEREPVVIPKRLPTWITPVTKKNLKCHRMEQLEDSPPRGLRSFHHEFTAQGEQPCPAMTLGTMNKCPARPQPTNRFMQRF